MEFSVLIQNLVDLIKEEQAKLGFRKESIRLYYPGKSLNNLLQTDLENEELENRITKYFEENSEPLGKVKVSYKGERFCFYLPEEAAVYVHENTKPSEFILKLIDKLSDHGTTLLDIKELFLSETQEVEMFEMKEEFDLMIRFKEGEDKYYYCFKDEGCHVIYHRFLPADFEDFGLTWNDNI